MEKNKLINKYFPELGDEIYISAAEQLDAWAVFAELLCSISSEETDQMTRDEVFDLFYTLYQKGYSSYGMPLYPLSAVIADGFTPIEIFTIIMASVCLCRLEMAKLFAGYLSEDNDKKILNIGNIKTLAGKFLDDDEIENGVLYDRDSFLNRCVIKGSDDDLLKHDGDFSRISLRESVAFYIACGELSGEIPENTDPEGPDRFPGLSAHPCIRLLDMPEEDADHICLSDTYAEIRRVLSYGGAIELDGAEGSGRKFLLTHAAGEYNHRIALIDMKLYDAITDDKEKNECIYDLVFIGRVRKVIPYLWCPDDPDLYEDSIRTAFTRLGTALPTVCIGANKPIPDDILGGLSESIYRITVPETNAKHQVVLWQEAAKKYGLNFPKKYDYDVLVSKYIMSCGRIYETMRNVASAMADAGDDTISEDILEDQIRRSCSVQFGENATRLSSPFVWDDLMISPESENLLRMAADRVRYRTTVNEDFGFAKKLPYGRGVAIVFYGPPGTGKTMAAQVLANDLGLDIYRIDLSQVSSKYIGETEKNLGAVFDAAKNSNAILFFDEADSLFSKRTEVSSSNDKYANAETSYLLQKIEEYSGVSVLATNNMQSFDAAFKRRMTFVIPIEAPDEDTRFRLWEAVFPEGAPLDENVDLRIIAHSAELTGSSIKSAAVSAAYMAASKGRAICWEDIIMAVDMEGTKIGTLGLGNRLRELMISGID